MNYNISNCAMISGSFLSSKEVILVCLTTAKTISRLFFSLCTTRYKTYHFG